ncbi:acyltransferase family protein [Vibrio sp. M260118]|uniref:acyltransferase family protein n=1 Tax=Vibrio sp. M260118 TaxID=3020896 RepID=UPI002F3F1F0D
MKALQVMFGHSFQHLGFDVSYILQIFPGVPIFFVVSGFLVSASWERSSSSKAYFLNRILRIYPALIVCLVFSLLVVFISYDIEVNVVELIAWLTAQITFAQFYNPQFLRGFGVGVLNGSLWTISIELQFYLILPIMYYVFERINWNKLVLISVFILLCVINYYRYYNGHLWENLFFKLFCMTIFPYLNMFLLGVILQRNKFFVERYLSEKVLIWLAVYLSSIVVFDFVGMKTVGNGINPISATLLGLLTISFAYSFTGLFSTILGGNDISYGIYIYHMIFVNLFLHLSTFEPLVSLLSVFVWTIVFAMLSWRWVEKPMIDMKKHNYSFRGNS